MKSIITVTILLVVSLIQGCATITNGSSQEIPIRSTPSGAEVVIDGMNRGITPTVVTLKRRGNYTLTLKKECLDPVNIQIQRDFRFPKWFFGNMLFGGAVGWIVDVASGSAWSLYPYEVEGTLQPSSKPECASYVQQTKAQDLANRADLIDALSSDRSPEELRTIAMRLYEESDLSVGELDHIANKISADRNTLDPLQADALAWLCKSIGKSGKVRYKAFLEKISATAAHKKLRKYAQNSIATLTSDEDGIYTAIIK